MEKRVKRTERGWKGHFCASESCHFGRNTLLELGNKRIVVSTVGNYHPSYSGERSKKESEIGWNRYYETMAFWAKKEGAYWEADVSKEVPFSSKWAIDHLEEDTDLEADEMHEKVVAEITKKLPKLPSPRVLTP